MFLNIKMMIFFFLSFFQLCTFIARSASSRASLSLSILIVSLIIGRFGGDSARRIILGGNSAWRIILGGDSDWRINLGGDLGRVIGDIRREGRIETGAGCGGGGGAGAGAVTGADAVTCGGADRPDLYSVARVFISPGGIPDRLGKGERYIRINCAKRSSDDWTSENKNKIMDVYCRISIEHTFC